MFTLYNKCPNNRIFRNSKHPRPMSLKGAGIFVCIKSLQQVYGNCSCLVGEASRELDSAESDWCPTGCKMHIPYSILVFLGNFCVCMASSPFMAILMR